MKTVPPAFGLLALLVLLAPPTAQADGNVITALLLEGPLTVKDGDVVNASALHPVGPYFGHTGLVLNQSVKDRGFSVMDVVLQSRVDQNHVLSTLGVDARVVDKSSPVIAVFPLVDHQPPPGVGATRVDSERENLYILKSRIGRDLVIVLWAEPESRFHLLEMARNAVEREWIDETFTEGHLRSLEAKAERVSAVYALEDAPGVRQERLRSLAALHEDASWGWAQSRARDKLDAQLVYVQPVNDVLIDRHDRRAAEYDARYQRLLETFDREAARMQDHAFLAASQDQANFMFWQLWIAILLGALGVGVEGYRILRGPRRLRRRDRSARTRSAPSTPPAEPAPAEAAAPAVEPAPP